MTREEASLAIQDFIHGRRKLCLLCGANEPCHLKDNPQSPCTFEPTPMELLQLNKEKDAQIKTLKDELKKLHRIVGEDETTIGKEYLSLSDKYNALLAAAIEKDAKIARLMKFYDEHIGTPCEQIRHQEEIETKDAEIARLKEWQQITIGAGTDHETVVRMAATEYTAIAKQCWQDKYNDMLATAVKFAELTRGYAHWFHTAYREADDFLESPPVQEWRERQKEQS